MPLLLADLDNTLVDRIGAFRSWARSFVKRHRLGEGSVDWLIENDFDGEESRERFLREFLSGGRSRSRWPSWLRHTRKT